MSSNDKITTEKQNDEINAAPVAEFSATDNVINNREYQEQIALKDKRWGIIKERGFILSMIIVQMVIFAIFYVYKNFSSIMMAFQLRDVSGETVWTFKNFADIWKDVTSAYNGELLLSTVNTFKFFILGQVMFPIAFMTSYFMYKKVPGYKAFRLLFFIPSILSGVVWSTLYKNIIGMNGPIAALWQDIAGLSKPPIFLTDHRYALTFVMIYSVWMGIAGNFVLYSGTLTRIPPELIEVGMLDGIKWYQELIRVIVPLVWPTISTVWLLSLMGIFTASGNILLLTNGGAGTMTLSHYLFTRVYQVPESSNLYNYSSAIGLVLTILTLPVVFLVQWLLGKVENVEY